MDEPSLHAYGLIAEAIYRHAYSMATAEKGRWDKYLEPDNSQSELIYFHYSNSTFKRVVDALARLGIMNALGRQLFSFICTLEDARDLAERNCDAGPIFDDLLTTFVRLFGEYGAGYWGFETAKDVSFEPRKELIDVFNALVVLGYMAEDKSGYCWTNKMAPSMASAGFWTCDAEPQ